MVWRALFESALITRSGGGKNPDEIRVCD